ncbi:MAG: hypothetical protein LLF89_02565 [Spirochaetaceae bacterium]|nr:hypothetical protein [Spirochaetaceae bacterium]
MAAIKEWFGLYNVILNWIKTNWGEGAMEDYSRHIAHSCFKEEIGAIRSGGLKEIESRLVCPMRKDGGMVDAESTASQCIICVRKCPSLQFNSISANPNFKNMKDSCEFDFCVNEVIAQECGLVFKGEMLDDGCRWFFFAGENPGGDL